MVNGSPPAAAAAAEAEGDAPGGLVGCECAYGRGCTGCGRCVGIGEEVREEETEEVAEEPAAECVIVPADTMGEERAGMGGIIPAASWLKFSGPLSVDCGVVVALPGSEYDGRGGRAGGAVIVEWGALASDCGSATGLPDGPSGVAVSTLTGFVVLVETAMGATRASTLAD